MDLQKNLSSTQAAWRAVGLSLGRSGMEEGWVPRGTVTFSLYILLHCLEFEKENDLCVTM